MTRTRLHQYRSHRYKSPIRAKCLKTGVEVAYTQTHAFACPASRALVPAVFNNDASRISSALVVLAKVEVGGGLHASVAGSLGEQLSSSNRIKCTAAAVMDAPVAAWFKRMYNRLRELIDLRLWPMTVP
ncbi:hypothetical protein H9P43_008044 [Blastocladiella emersonii ATCC 22665]|nr:hypothetical protein H9P43_008044 [Blastocladiella emersonii ATCC 22665]